MVPQEFGRRGGEATKTGKVLCVHVTGFSVGTSTKLIVWLSARRVEECAAEQLPQHVLSKQKKREREGNRMKMRAEKEKKEEEERRRKEEKKNQENRINEAKHQLSCSHTPLFSRPFSLVFCCCSCGYLTSKYLH